MFIVNSAIQMSHLETMLEQCNKFGGSRGNGDQGDKYCRTTEIEYCCFIVKCKMLER